MRSKAAARSKPALLYEARVSLGAISLLPLLGLPAFALLQWALVTHDDVVVAPYIVIRAFELILPLISGMASAHLMTVEREEGVSELRLSYPESRWCLPATRTGIALALATVAALLGVLAFRPVFGPTPLGELLEPALSPTLLLIGLSLLVGNATGSYWSAAGLVIGYWFFEVQTRGDVTGSLFLFQYAWPVGGVSYALNRRLLAGLGLLCCLANAWLSARRKPEKGVVSRGDR
ncbi:MAG: hypothetical protein ACP5HG_09170 [Anaerolineae bacterium]